MSTPKTIFSPASGLGPFDRSQSERQLALIKWQRPLRRCRARNRSQIQILQYVLTAAHDPRAVS